MHKSSLENMRYFINKYMDSDKSYKILDLGSQVVDGEINGSYKSLFNNDKWEYFGADVVSGDNVDIVLEKPYKWANIKNRTFDCIVCGQMLEHCEYFWLTILEIRRVLKVNGLCCIIAPSGGVEHRYPVDCYRYYPDGMRAIAKYAGLTTVETYAQWNRELYKDMDDMWRDCVLICKREKEDIFTKIKYYFKHLMLQFGSMDENKYVYNISYTTETTYRMPRQTLIMSVYFDTGNDFSEKEVLHEEVFASESIKKKYKLPEKCKRVRFDPVEGSGCIVRNLCIFIDGKLLHTDDLEINGEIKENCILFLDTNDPQILIHLHSEENCYIDIGAEVYYFVPR